MNTTRNVIVLTRASSGSGALTARALADAGDTDTVYAGMRETEVRNSARLEAAHA